MIRIISCFLIMAVFSGRVLSQSDSLQQQINQHVWRPFIQSFNNLDTKGFMAVHSLEMTRVIRDGNMIYGYERYNRENLQGDERARKANRKRTIELRFLQRIAGNDRAFEIGYYKTTNIQPDGTAKSFYGKFHVLLRKENSIWKILMDADASEKTDEAVFSSASPLQ